MPATFPSHQGAVLPLKLWRPLWFDGVALGVGAAAPDVAYLLDGSGLPAWRFSHEPVGLIAWCLPVTLVLSWLIRRAAGVVAAHLPAGGPLALRDYGVLARCRPRWSVTASSAIVGAVSHLALDFVGAPLAVAEWALHLLGAYMIWRVMARTGQRRLLVAWHGPPPVVEVRPLAFWGSVAAVAVPGLAVLPLPPAASLQHTTAARMIAVAAAALLVAAAVASRCKIRG